MRTHMHTHTQAYIVGIQALALYNHNQIINFITNIICPYCVPCIFQLHNRPTFTFESYCNILGLHYKFITRSLTCAHVVIFHTDEHIPGTSHHRRLSVVCHVQLRRSHLDDWYLLWRQQIRSWRYPSRGELLLCRIMIIFIHRKHKKTGSIWKKKLN